MKRPGFVRVSLFGGAFLALLLYALPVGCWLKLELRGQVPENASFGTREGAEEWRVAEWTTWWGRTVDPRKFWQGRVIWDDVSARVEARRYGRQYPPIPVHLTNLIAGFPLESRSQADIVPGAWSGGLDGGRIIPLHYTDAENAYWNWFWGKHPKPPEELERKQVEVEGSILASQNFNVVLRGWELNVEGFLFPAFHFFNLCPSVKAAPSQNFQAKFLRLIVKTSSPSLGKMGTLCQDSDRNQHL